METKEVLREYLLSKLDEIHDSKKGKQEPDYVLMVELTQGVIKDVKENLNQMYLNKEIRVGDTLNDKYIIAEKW